MARPKKFPKKLRPKPYQFHISSRSSLIIDELILKAKRKNPDLRLNRTNVVEIGIALLSLLSPHDDIPEQCATAGEYRELILKHITSLLRTSSPKTKPTKKTKEKEDA